MVLSTNSINKPEPSNKTAAIMKSNKDQFTSAVNRMAIKGMSSKTATVIRIMITLVFFIRIVFK